MRVCFLEDVVVAALSLYVYGSTGLLLGHMVASCSGIGFEKHVCFPDWWHQFTFLPAVSEGSSLHGFLSISVCCLCFCHLMAHSVRHGGGGLCLPVTNLFASRFCVAVCMCLRSLLAPAFPCF